MKNLFPLILCIPLIGNGLAEEIPVKKSIFDSTALSGEWGGIRSKDSGITIELGYTQEYLGVVSGGIRRQGEYNAVASLDLEFDLEKLAGWKGAIFHATGFSIIGDSLSGRDIGDDSNVSNINFRNSVRLFEMYLDQTLLDGKISIRAGQLAADSEFFGSEIGEIPGGGLFLNSDFGAMPIASFNAPVPIYAIAAPGIRVRVNPTKSTFIQVAAYDGNPAPDFLGDPSPGFQGGNTYNDHGIDVHLDSSEGAFLIGEAGFTINQAKVEPSVESTSKDGKNGKTVAAAVSTPHGLPGSYKIGGYYHTDDFTRWSDGSAVSGIWAAYAIGAQKVCHENTEDDQGLYLFARGSIAPENRATLDWAVDGGLNYVGAIPGRDADVMGIACTCKHYSGDLSDSLKASGEEGVDAESILEVTYQINLAPWLTIQPDFQYVFSPGGRASSEDAAVVGVRVSTLF